jgi:tyrosine-protein phosphatase OCA1
MASAHYIPPPNFGTIEEGLYRSGEPNEISTRIANVSADVAPTLTSELNRPHPHISLHHTRADFPFLEKLQLTKIIYLAPDDPSRSFVSFCADSGIELLHLGKEQHKTPWKPISEDVVLRTLTHIMEPASYPLAIMCHLGRHRTGTAVGCLRKLQRWNLASIFEEYRRFAGAKVRPMNEQFIELFDCDLVAIPKIPPKALAL